MTKRLIVIFGAAVHAGGQPSAALRRRVEMGVAAAIADPDSALFCSGGIGRHPPAEAVAMRDLIGDRIAEPRINLDDVSRDTLQTVAAATAFACANGFDACGACTDRYHQPRVRMLFALFGMPCRPAPSAPRGWRQDTRMRLREGAAIPYDLVAGIWAVMRGAGRPR